jgi:ADP-heptose:LPS heptosyltransferase
MFHLGAQRRPIPRARLFVERKLAEGAYAVLHPFAASPEKTWPAERFLEVASHLDVQGLEAVFVGGPGDDVSPFTGYRTLAGAPLRELKSLLAGASLFMGNDSGPAHIAAAFGVPVVVLFGPSDHIVWAPWQVESEVLTSGGEDIRSIATEQAIHAIDQLRVAR